jgi:hypothetical protein
MNHQGFSVFISYASEDFSHARSLASVLSNEGFLPWLDRDKLLPGHDWKLEIEKAVSEADAIVLCLSKLSTNKRGYVQKEIKKALDMAKEQPEGAIFIIPARLEPCSVPHRLQDLQWVNVYEDNGLSQLIDALKVIAKQLGRPVIPLDIDDPLVGEYYASGNNSDGSKYSGKVIISPQGKNYLVTWYVADDHFEADGIRNADEFTVRGDFDFVYHIKDNGILKGEWEENAYEELTKVQRE